MSLQIFFSHHNINCGKSLKELPKILFELIKYS
jgi:hypothetical protein